MPAPQTRPIDSAAMLLGPGIIQMCSQAKTQREKGKRP